jgi:hypothetical protein
VSISGYVGTVKGRTAIRIFNRFRKLKEKPYWGNHFWARGYCVDTVGLDSEYGSQIHQVSRGKRTRNLSNRNISQRWGQLNLAPSGVGSFDHPWENHRPEKNFVGKDHTTNIWDLGAI